MAAAAGCFERPNPLCLLPPCLCLVVACIRWTPPRSWTRAWRTRPATSAPATRSRRAASCPTPPPSARPSARTLSTAVRQHGLAWSGLAACWFARPQGMHAGAGAGAGAPSSEARTPCSMDRTLPAPTNRPLGPCPPVLSPPAGEYDLVSTFANTPSLGGFNKLCTTPGGLVSGAGLVAGGRERGAVSRTSCSMQAVWRRDLPSRPTSPTRAVRPVHDRRVLREEGVRWLARHLLLPGAWAAAAGLRGWAGLWRCKQARLDKWPLPASHTKPLPLPAPHCLQVYRSNKYLIGSPLGVTPSCNPNGPYLASGVQVSGGK